MPNWTWGFRAADLKRFAPPEYEVHVEPEANFGRQGTLEAKRLLGEVDAIFYMSWPFAPITRLRDFKARLVTLVTSCGALYEYRDGEDGDWNWWCATKNRNRGRAVMRLPAFDAVITVNLQIHQGVRSMNRNTHMVPSGVNEDFWTPTPVEPHDKLRVGWCASPRGKKFSSGRTRSVKGYVEVLQPLMEATGDRYDWVLNTRDYSDALTRDEMRAWYADIDVLLCTSINEGTPSPVFEACCSGRPFVATDVGMVHDWPAAHDQGCVVPAYSNADGAAATVVAFDRALRRMEDVWWRRVCVDQLRRSCIDRYSYRHIAPKYLRVIAGDE